MVQTSPTEVYMPYIAGRQLQTGNSLFFYNLQNLSYDGGAKVASIAPNTDPLINQAFSNTLNNLALLNLTTNLSRITLDRPVQMTSLVDLVDIQEVCQEMSFLYRRFEIACANLEVDSTGEHPI